MSQTISPLFDRPTLRRRRERMARRTGTTQDLDFLWQEAAEILLDRLNDIRRTFSCALDIGARTGLLAPFLAGRSGITDVISVDIATTAVCHARPLAVAADEEHLPFANACADLVISCMSLHWTNDVPAMLSEVRRVLKPGGLFLAILPGEETLRELRNAMAQAELDVCGGISPRVSPMLTIKDAGSLLQAAGFDGPVIDRDRITVNYREPLHLMTDLRAMGESNAMTERLRRPLRRDLLGATLDTYRQIYGTPDGQVPATFDLLTLTAWKAETEPHS